MRCRGAICAACTTRLDGVNHCRACLDALRAPALAAAPPRSNALGRALVILSIHGGVLILVTLLAMFWRGRA